MAKSSWSQQQTVPELALDHNKTKRLGSSESRQGCGLQKSGLWVLKGLGFASVACPDVSVAPVAACTDIDTVCINNCDGCRDPSGS